MKANYNQVRAALDAASPDIRLYLFHGPDEAGARDLAARLARTMGPEAERVDLEPATLRSQPGRLADEAASLSLFGSARHIRVAGAGDESIEACTLLLAAERAGSPVVMIAPGIKTSSALVKLVSGASRALSFACYLPEGDEADKLATSIAREHGLRTIGGTATRVAAAAGGDRAVMTRELEKLALYLDAAPERPRELDDATLDAVGADLGDSEMARAIDAAIEGGPDRVAAELARLDTAGASPVPLLRQLVRRLMTLAELRAEIDRGASIASVTDKVFLEKRRRPHVRYECGPRHVSTRRLTARRAERAVMLPGNAGAVLGEAAVIAVARMAARLRG